MFWPYMIPYSVTVANAAAPDASLGFLFYGGAVVLPIIVVYTIGVYWVFRGKVGEMPAGALGDRIQSSRELSGPRHPRESIDEERK